MKAGENYLVKFLQQQDTQFIIPVYQRNYDWTHKHCDQLLKDIRHVAKHDAISSHFLGSIVYIYDDISRLPSDPYYLTIIDGQQRITTITLLWLTLYRKAKEIQNKRLADEIWKKYLVNEFLDGDAKVKLKPTQNNETALKHLLHGDLDQSYGEYSNLIENFHFFYSGISHEDVELIKQGIHKLVFVEISLNRDYDNPQRIFESLNSTGLELSQGDLIRNYILMGLRQKQQKQMYSKYWMPIENYTTEKETSTLMVSDFMRHYLTLKFRSIPPKNKVYETFKRVFPFTDVTTLEDILIDIRKYASFYQKLINPDEEPEQVIREHIQLVNQLEINVSYPFILEVYHDYHNGVINKETFVEILQLIQSYVWRRFVCGVPTNALNKVFLRLYEDIDSSDYLLSLQKALVRKKDSQRFPDDDEVQSELKVKNVYNTQSKNRMYFLERLENYKSKEPVKIAGNPDITIEHIFPQIPSLKWKQVLSDDEYHAMDAKKNTISNLTLSGNNGALGNKPFQEKRDLPGKGYRDSKLFLNKYLTSIERWTPYELDERFNIIFERFKEVWPYPDLGDFELEELETLSEEAVNIFDIDDPTGKKPEYIIFFEQKILVKTNKELYQRVLIDLFDLHPLIFHETRAKEKLKYAQTAEKLASPVKISESYFAEANLSAPDIFSRIKYVLEACNIYDELYVKFREAAENKIDKEQFLNSLDNNGVKVFQQIFEFAEQHGLLFRWGVKGFSLNIPFMNNVVLLFWGYPPSVYGQSIYTGFEEITRKVNNPEEIIGFYKASLENLGYFVSTQSKYSNVKWVLDQPYSDQDVERFLSVIQSVIAKIKEKGLK